MSPISNETMVVVTMEKVGIDVRASTFQTSASQTLQPGFLAALYLADMPPAWDSTIASERPKHS